MPAAFDLSICPLGSSHIGTMHDLRPGYIWDIVADFIRANKGRSIARLPRAPAIEWTHLKVEAHERDAQKATRRTKFSETASAVGDAQKTPE